MSLALCLKFCCKDKKMLGYLQYHRNMCIFLNIHWKVKNNSIHFLTLKLLQNRVI